MPLRSSVRPKALNGLAGWVVSTSSSFPEILSIFLLSSKGLASLVVSFMLAVGQLALEQP